MLNSLQILIKTHIKIQIEIHDTKQMLTIPTVDILFLWWWTNFWCNLVVKRYKEETIKKITK